LPSAVQSIAIAQEREQAYTRVQRPCPEQHHHDYVRQRINWAGKSCGEGDSTRWSPIGAGRVPMSRFPGAVVAIDQGRYDKFGFRALTANLFVCDASSLSECHPTVGPLPGYGDAIPSSWDQSDSGCAAYACRSDGTTECALELALDHGCGSPGHPHRCTSTLQSNGRRASLWCCVQARQLSLHAYVHLERFLQSVICSLGNAYAGFVYMRRSLKWAA
jgi:hypothetical protein